jgi:predicted porin
LAAGEIELHVRGPSAYVVTADATLSPMKTLLRLVLPSIFTTAALAVYAPIPEQEQGKALSFRMGASIYYDSNIFGSATGEIESMIYNVSPAVLFNSSISDQTFLSASYELSVDHYTDRPGSKDLAGHKFDARIAHAFSQATNLDVSEMYQISRNPESALNGVPINVDQSLNLNEFNARFTTNAGEKAGVVFKYRNQDYDYTNSGLGDSLNRMEQLAGLELSYAFLPETKLVGEYRYQDISYNHDGADKDKQSNFLMAGVDYSPGQKLTVSSRLGFEARSRSGESDTTVPHVELSARYNYAEQSYFATGYTYSIQEPSDTTHYTDSKVNSFFINLQQALSPMVTASGSLTYEPAELLGRGGHPSINEDTTRFGLALSWLPDKNWTISATYDLDHVNSDDPSRGQDRTRLGVSARLVF